MVASVVVVVVFFTILNGLLFLKKKRLFFIIVVRFPYKYKLLFLLQKTGGPVLLSLLGAVGAVVGVPVAVFLQGERPPEGLLLGATLIAIGVAAVTWGGIQAAKSKKISG